MPGFFALLVLFLFSFLSSSLAAGANLIKIVLLTTPAKFSAEAGKPYLRGAEMAVAELNAREGKMGIQFLLFLREGLHTEEKEIQELGDILAKEQAHSLMGAVVKGAILPVSRLARQYSLPFLVFPADFMETASTGAEPDNLFWMSPAPEALQRAAVRTAGQFPKKRFFLLAKDSKIGRSWAKYFWEELGRLKPDAKPVGEILLSGKVGDYGPYLRTILAANTEVCVSHLGAKEWVRFVKTAQKQGYFKKITHFELESGSLESLVALQKDAPERVWGISVFPFWALGWKETKEFVAKYRERTQSYPGLEALSGYVSIYALFEAMKKGGSLNPQGILKAMPGLSFPTPIGPLAIRPADHRALWPIWCGVSAFISDYPFAILEELKSFGPDSFRP